MEELELSELDLHLLNSSAGYRNLLKPKTLDVQRTLRRVKYEYKLKELQREMIKLQQWVYANNKQVIIIAEGRDAAGKGGAIRRMTEHLNPRLLRIVALPKPNKSEKKQWYFQRYAKQLPKVGEMVFFNRSWYNRAMVEPVNGFCTERQYETFMKEVNLFEDMLSNDGIRIIKLYFSISKEEQVSRFSEIQRNPLKKWKISPVDLNAIKLWDKYTEYKVRMINETNREKSPWVVIKADRKTDARIEAMEYILSQFDYQEKL
jgi:polyphosphate kinase 2